MNRVINPKSVRHCRVERFFLFMATALTLAACHPPQDEPTQLLGQAQGTYYSIQYIDPLKRNLQPQIDSLLNAFDQSASLWVENSLLRRINRGTTDSLDTTLQFLFEQSIRILNYTDGAFDPRVGKLVQAWGFSFKQRQEPDSATLEQLITAAHASIWLDGNRLHRDNPNTEIDFNAIAQGYSSDLVGQLLEQHGISNYLVDIGGEVLAHGKKGSRPWRVGIERPSDDSASAPTVQLAIQLNDASVVTSGSYRKYYERNGIRYSHTIDPTTGRPVSHTLLSVSVVEKESWLADAMATAYMVMGLDKAKQFIASHPNEPGTEAVYFIYSTPTGQLATYATPTFEKLIVKQ